MKNKALFSSKDKSKKIKCRLLQFLFGNLRVKEFAVLEAKSSLSGLILFFSMIWQSRAANRKSQKLYPKSCKYGI